MNKKKVLIVDDEKDALVILEKELAGRGYSVISADNGADAINRAKMEHPDLIILDIWMPGMDGTDVAEKLKQNPTTRDIPVIFLTCLFQKTEEDKLGHVVKDRVLFAKPYDIKELTNEIEMLTNGQSVPR